MGGLCVTNRESLKPTALRMTAALCCMLVFFGAVTSLMVFSGRPSIWGRWGISRKSIMADDHLQVLEEDRDERNALTCDEHSYFAFDRQTSDTATAAPLTENMQAATYGATSIYLVDQTITLYLDKNIIGSSE